MYLTLLNKLTNKSVPFERLANGEIKILSADARDTDDNVFVKLTKLFYEYSIDFDVVYGKA
jgi:hypothetical protein